MNILSIYNFTTKPRNKCLYIGVYVKGTMKFDSKVINRQLFDKKNCCHMKTFSTINFTTKLLSVKDYFLNGKKFSSSKVTNRQYFYRKTGLKSK